MRSLFVGIVAGVLVASSLVLPAHAAAIAGVGRARRVRRARPGAAIDDGDDTVDELALHEAHVAQQAQKAADPTPGDAAAQDAAAQRAVLDAGTADRGFVAAAVAPFSAGNLISDSNFRNGSAMTEAEIQAFLKRMVGTCASSSCLANLKMNTPTRTWSFGTCATYRGGTAESAARIIYKVQRACNLSAKVILVTLQKEQSLLTDPAPTAGVLRKAMGYGCPDTAACDSTYYGFFNQVFAAAQAVDLVRQPGRLVHLAEGRPGEPHPVPPRRGPLRRVERDDRRTPPRRRCTTTRRISRTRPPSRTSTAPATRARRTATGISGACTATGSATRGSAPRSRSRGCRARIATRPRRPSPGAATRHPACRSCTSRRASTSPTPSPPRPPPRIRAGRCCSPRSGRSRARRSRN